VPIVAPDVALAAGLALAAAAVFGLGSAAQQRAAARAAGGARLVRDPGWVAGVLGVGVGLTCRSRRRAVVPGRGRPDRVDDGLGGGQRDLRHTGRPATPVTSGRGLPRSG
jgi:hypothetical protein